MSSIDAEFSAADRLVSSSSNLSTFMFASAGAMRNDRGIQQDQKERGNGINKDSKKFQMTPQQGEFVTWEFPASALSTAHNNASGFIDRFEVARLLP